MMQAVKFQFFFFSVRVRVFFSLFRSKYFKMSVKVKGKAVMFFPMMV